jgi:hypothetical protein
MALNDPNDPNNWEDSAQPVDIGVWRGLIYRMLPVVEDRP